MPRPPRDRVHQQISSRRVPRRPGISSQAVKVEFPGEMLYIAQQLPIAGAQGKLVGQDSQRQIEVCLSNLVNLLKDASFTTDHVVQLRAYLLDLADENSLDTAISKAFVGGNYPAITVIKAAELPLEAAVAMDAVAIKPAEDEVY